MSHTITYKGWISFTAPKMGRDPTVIVSPNKFFYRPRNHILAEKISADTCINGPFVNIRVWICHYKIGQKPIHLVDSYMGILRTCYSEVSNSKNYIHSHQYMDVNNFNLFEHLASYHHHYCIIEITYNRNEFDMIAHEAELILLRN
jgi:hypothetical protein